jgi:hypothetical protein
MAELLLQWSSKLKSTRLQEIAKNFPRILSLIEEFESKFDAQEAMATGMTT